MLMEEPPKQESYGPLHSQAILNDFVREKPQLRNRFDAMSLAIHAAMRQLGFRFVGVGDSDDENANKTAFAPEGWNRSTDAYNFRYKHPKRTGTFVIKSLVMGETLLVHGLAADGKTVVNFEANIEDYMNPNASLDDFEHLFKNLDLFVTSFANNIVYNMLPELVPQQETRYQATAQDDQERRQPHYDPYNDPLRVPPRREPRSPLMEGGPHYPQPAPFAIGGGDLNPFGLAPPGYGGNLVGPTHPGFGPRVRDPYGGHPFGPGAPAPPPGARFDPFGPPRGGNNPFGEPDRDDLPPPGGPNYDMFL